MSFEELLAATLLLSTAGTFTALFAFLVGISKGEDLAAADLKDAFDHGLSIGRLQAVGQHDDPQPEAVLKCDGVLSEKLARNIRSGWGR